MSVEHWQAVTEYLEARRQLLDALTPLACALSTTDELATTLVSSHQRLGVQPTDFIAIVRGTSAVMRYGSEWTFVAPLKRWILQKADPATAHTAHRFLLDLTRNVEAAIHRPRYLAWPVGSIYHQSALSPDGAASAYLAAFRGPLTAGQWLLGIAATEQQELGIIGADAIEPSFIRAVNALKQGDSSSAALGFDRVLASGHVRPEVAAARLLRAYCAAQEELGAEEHWAIDKVRDACVSYDLDVARIDGMNRELRILRNDRDEVALDRARLLAEKSRYLADIEERKSEFDRVLAELAHVRDAANDALKRERRLATDLEQARSDLDEERARREEIDDELAGVSAELASASEERDTLESQNELLKARLAKVEAMPIAATARTYVDAWSETVALRSETMRKFMRLAEVAARRNTAVLIQGERGTGKEWLAHWVHSRGNRVGPFVTLNCGAIPENLLESELFGHEKGAFTGAASRRAGLVEMAEGGTLFLDAIDELPMALQAKLLRVLQEREYRPIGSAIVRRADFRLIAASEQDLDSLAEAGSFRQDLYYRLRAFVLQMPPLRERKEDIEPLTLRFLRDAAKRTGSLLEAMDPQVMAQLRGYSWPGNVRELQILVERAVEATPRDSLFLSKLPFEITTERAWHDETLSREDQRAYLEEVLRQNEGNYARAARQAGVSIGEFRRRIAESKNSGERE